MSIAGKDAGAASFPGDVNSISSIAGIPLSSPYTMSAWVYDTATAGSIRGVWGKPAGYRHSVVFNAYSVSQQFNLLVNDAENRSVNAYAINACHYVVTTCQGGVRTLYVDGAPDGLTTAGLAFTLT